ncbi:MAG: 16S rRNA (cytidine(1402)-2'-O)-methyltransferase [Pseudomonadota bacterium]
MPKESSSKANPSQRAEPNHSQARSKPIHFAPGLYLVATPIGNLADLSRRAHELLEKADIVACEDSRVTGKLISAYGIARSLTAYHDHNAARVRPKLIERLKDGAIVALVSDAGTPLVSDPGYKLVQEAIEAQIPVSTLPGPSAALGALVVSGLPSDRFFFAGFLPNKSSARRDALDELAAVPGSLIFFESAKRLATALGDMAARLGDRPAAVVRELTKRFEEVRRDQLSTLATHYAASGPPKGEIVVVVGPPEAPVTSDEALSDQLRVALESASLRDAVVMVAAASGRPRREVYQMALRIGGDPP